MIHYHGTPLSSKVNAAKVLAGRHALISHATPGYVEVAADVCQSFVLDNGAFTHFRQGKPKGIADWFDYYEWAAAWLHHPGCDWAIIPDIIDGSEEDNDRLMDLWPHKGRGVPVYHLHESLDRLRRMADAHGRIALGSSGEFWQVGSDAWWRRMDEVLGAICDGSGRPRTKLHGLRMLNWKIFSQLPLASADSVNVGINCGYVAKLCEASPDVGATVIAQRVESHNSADRFTPHSINEQASQEELC